VVGHAELGAGRVQLADAVLPQPAAVAFGQVGQRRRDDLTEFAQRASDQRDLRSFGGIPGHRRPGADRLVIGVRVHQQQAPA
jgi:hypothetical protein